MYLHRLKIISDKVYLFSSALSSRNASTLATSDLLALIIMVQNMYPNNVDQDEAGSEVGEHRGHPQHHHAMCITVSDCILSLSVREEC